MSEMEPLSNGNVEDAVSENCVSELKNNIAKTDVEIKEQKEELGKEDCLDEKPAVEETNGVTENPSTEKESAEAMEVDASAPAATETPTEVAQQPTDESATAEEPASKDEPETAEEPAAKDEPETAEEPTAKDEPASTSEPVESVAEPKVDSAADKSTAEKPLAETVAKHYNELKEAGKETRKDSRIFYLRNFNNWAKSTLITEYLEKIKRRKRTSEDVVVLDMACGKGGDLLKWQKGRVDHVLMADIADTSIEQCRKRYAQLESSSGGSRGSRSRLFGMEAATVDCTKEKLCEKWKKGDTKIDLSSCQFAFHYSFESYDQAAMMVRNACEKLRVGGFWIGTTPDSNQIVKKMKASSAEDGSFGNSVFSIRPEVKDSFPLFGAKYMFHLEGVVDCPEFLVYFPVVEKLAAKYDMKLIMKRNFHDLYRHYERDYGFLLQRMSALEQYPASGDKSLCSDKEEAYKHAADYLERKAGKVKSVGTLTKEEWEAAGLYVAFVFEKMPPREDKEERKGREDRKRAHDTTRVSDSGRSHSKDKNSRDDKNSRGGRKDQASSSKRSKSGAEEEFQVMDSIECDDDEEPATKPDEKLEAEPAKQAADASGETQSAAADTTSETVVSGAVAEPEAEATVEPAAEPAVEQSANAVEPAVDVVAMEATSSESVAEADTTSTEEAAIVVQATTTEQQPSSSSDDVVDSAVAEAVADSSEGEGAPARMEADSSADAVVESSEAVVE